MQIMLVNLNQSVDCVKKSYYKILFLREIDLYKDRQIETNTEFFPNFLL